MSSVSTGEAVVLGVLVGLFITAVRVLYVLCTTRLHTMSDYLLAALFWYRERRSRSGRNAP